MSAELAAESPLRTAWLDDASLAALLAGAADGDREAFLDFYDATCALVWRLEVRRARTRTAAEAATRRRFFAAWARAGEQPASGLSPRAWLLSLSPVAVTSAAGAER